MSPRNPRNRRDEDYAIAALAKGVKVLEALEGTRIEPVSIQRIMQRTGYSYNFCLRALRTLKCVGFAAQTPEGWSYGPRILKLADRFGEVCVVALQPEQQPGAAGEVG